MMSTITALFVVTLAQTPAQAPSTPPVTASAEVMHCVQAQMVVDRLLDAADTRMELARQSNNVADLRAAVDALQATVRDVRAQLAPCANVQPAPDPHLVHRTSPASPPPSTSGAGAPAAPGTTPAAADPHAGHTMTPATPPAPTKAAPPAAPRAPRKPPAADPHAGHTAAPSKPDAKAEPPAPDPHAGHTAAPSRPATPQEPAKPEADAPAQVDTVCGLQVDPKAAPSTTHNGRSYYFCSEEHKQLFQKDPARYLPKME